MKKKEYKAPFIRVVEVKSCNILYGSGEGSYNETLSNGRNEGSEPEKDDDGWVWTE